MDHNRFDHFLIDVGRVVRETRLSRPRAAIRLLANTDLTLSDPFTLAAQQQPHFRPAGSHLTDGSLYEVEVPPGQALLSRNGYFWDNNPPEPWLRTQLGQDLSRTVAYYGRLLTPGSMEGWETSFAMETATASNASLSNWHKVDLSFLNITASPATVEFRYACVVGVKGVPDFHADVFSYHPMERMRKHHLYPYPSRSLRIPEFEPAPGLIAA